MATSIRLHPHHVDFYVSDIQRTAKWWEDLFGYKLRFQHDFFLPGIGETLMAWIEIAPHFYVELCEFPKLEPFSREHYNGEYGTKHFCFYVADEYFDPMVSYLEEQGVDIVIRAEHEPERMGKNKSTKVIFITDPDGNMIEIQQTFNPGEY